MLTQICGSLAASIRHSVRPLARHIRSRCLHPGADLSYPVNAVECAFEDNVKILANATLSNVQIGRCSYVGGESVVKNCIIGRFCSIAPEVRIGLGIHPTQDVVSTYPGFYSANASGVRRYRQDASVTEFQPISIGNDVWVGIRAVIGDGVTIGDGAIIAAGSVVTSDVAPYAIVGGVPARTIRCRVTENQRAELLRIKWWNWSDDQISAVADNMLNIESFLATQA